MNTLELIKKVENQARITAAELPEWEKCLKDLKEAAKAVEKVIKKSRYTPYELYLKVLDWGGKPYLSLRFDDEVGFETEIGRIKEDGSMQILSSTHDRLSYTQFLENKGTYRNVAVAFNGCRFNLLYGALTINKVPLFKVHSGAPYCPNPTDDLGFIHRYPNGTPINY